MSFAPFRPKLFIFFLSSGKGFILQFLTFGPFVSPNEAIVMTRLCSFCSDRHLHFILFGAGKVFRRQSSSFLL